MAWSIRSLADASVRVRGAFRQYMPGTDTALKNNFVTVAGKVLAGLAHEFELRMAYLAKQLFISSATGQYLVMHCADIGIYRKQATAAAGQITGAAAPSMTYPAGLRFISGNVTYLSSDAATSSADGSLSVSVLAETKGLSSNREADGLLSLADPVLYPDLGLTWTVAASALGGGADIEGDDSLRARGLQRKRNPPAGGTLADYERIALAVPGVVASWAFRGSSPGSVYLFFLFAGRVNLIPQESDVVAVQAAVDAQRLIRVDDSIAVAPTPRPIDVTIAGLVNDTVDVRAAIEAGISAMFVAKCRPGIVGNTFTMSVSWIDEVISGTAGEIRHELLVPAAGSDPVMTDGQFPVLGTVSYVS